MSPLFEKQYIGWHIVYRFLFFKLKVRRKFVHNVNLNLVFDTKAGIGNRIFGLVNCINHTKPKSVNMFWDDKGWVSARFFDLFETDFDFKINEFNDIKDFFACANDKKAAIVNLPPCDLKTLAGKSLSLKYNEIAECDIEEYNKIFMHIKPSKAVLERLKEVKIPESFVALQVRNNADWGEYGRNEAFELFFQEIESFPENTVFFLSAMNKTTSKMLKERYGSRIIELPNKDYSSMIDAVADLFIMSRANEAIYSYGSTFSELAFWFSGGRQKCVVVGNGMCWKSN